MRPRYAVRQGQIVIKDDVVGLIAFVADAGIDERRAVLHGHAMAVVDMAKDMQLWPYAPDGLGQVMAADVFTVRCQVQDAEGRAVGNQHIGVARDQGPFFCQRPAARQVKCPLKKLGLPGRAIKPDAVNDDGAVLQISGVAEQGLPVLPAQPFQTAVVVARHHQFVPVRQGGQKPVEAPDFILTPTAAYITGTYQHIPVGNVQDGLPGRAEPGPAMRI